ncbi:uncharacterized protein LOC128640476 [Bombina bombina]|uniref:uncharacterized protein LOC128640476 n=1 Tax=Bombina bombina TaxID=8345 RepID=UPI00235A5D68|nr:uncharacterized protein LOC128640476 [Bombina bombina]
MEAQENTHTIYQDMATTSTTEESVTIYSEDVLESTRDLDDYCDEIKTFADQDEDLFEADTDDLTYELSRSPVTTESYIDTTAVLLPSGGSLSHQQALKTSVCETEPHQYSNYDFKNQRKDKDTNHSELYDFPKKHSGSINISRSTIPFSLGTFVEQDKTHDSFIRETINSKTIQNTAKQSLEINTKQYILDANESSINIDNLLKDAGRLHHRDSGILWKIENNQCTEVETFNINNQVGPQGWDDMYIDSEIIKEDPKILNTQDQEVEQIINSVLEEAIKVKYNKNMPENPSDISTSEKEDKYLENHNEILDYHVMCKEVDSNEEIKSKTMEVQDKYADSLDLNVARNQQKDLIDIASITCQLSLEESIARITLPETMERGLRQRDIYYENEQVKINVSEEETICLFKEAEQQEAVFKNSERVESVRYFSDDHDKVNDDEIVFTEQHTNIPCCEYDTNMQVMLQTAVEEYPGKKDTARNEILYESIIKDDPIREPGEPCNRMEQILENAGVLLNPYICGR